jgi:hypothetical protein
MRNIEVNIGLRSGDNRAAGSLIGPQSYYRPHHHPAQAALNLRRIKRDKSNGSDARRLPRLSNHGKLGFSAS